MTASQPRVQIDVEELLVEAAGPYQADRLARLVEEELAMLMGHEGVPASTLHAQQAGERLATISVAAVVAGAILQRMRAERAL